MESTAAPKAMKSTAPVHRADTSFPGYPGRPEPTKRATRRRHTLITVRQATREDCSRIARLFMIASDGIAEYIWSRTRTPDLSLLEIGERRYARTGTAFSYEHCLVAEKDAAVVGMVHSFPMVEPQGDGSQEQADPVLAP